MLIDINEQELATILTGLRLYQRAPTLGLELEDIATNGGEHDVMLPTEVDDLCERINGGNAAPMVRIFIDGGVFQNSESNYPKDVTVEVVDYDVQDDEYDTIVVHDNGNKSPANHWEDKPGTPTVSIFRRQ